MKKLFVYDFSRSAFFLLLILSSMVYAQPENSGKAGVMQLPNFFYDAYSYRSKDTATTRVDMYVQVPYENIQFVKKNNMFVGGYSVTLSIYDAKKENLITEKIFGETVKVQDFNLTDSRRNQYLSLRSFELPPADYSLRCEVEDRDTKKSFVKEDKFTVRNLRTNPSLSDVILVSRFVTVDSAKKIIPNISRNVSTQKNGIGLFFEIYSDRELNASIEYSIINKKEDVIYKSVDSVLLKTGTNQINANLSNTQVSMGEYSLLVYLNDETGKHLCQAQKKFISKWVGLPNSAEDLDKAIDQMRYIAKDNELDEIKDTKNAEEKLEKYTAYWKKKDPSPSTEDNETFNEYYRRIAYANEHFKNYTEGWKTDMGMVYVTLGPPSNIERHPFEYDSKPYEVWDYYDINKRFIFVDQSGFGDYRLLSPSYGTWWKYRE